MDYCNLSYLASGEFFVPVLFGLGEDAGMEHRGVGALGTVLATQHSKRQLRIVNHRGHYESGSAQLGPVSPSPFRSRLSA